MRHLLDRLTALAAMACGNSEKDLEYYYKFCDEMYKLELELVKANLLDKPGKKPSEAAKKYSLAMRESV